MKRSEMVCETCIKSVTYCSDTQGPIVTTCRAYPEPRDIIPRTRTERENIPVNAIRADPKFHACGEGNWQEFVKTEVGLFEMHDIFWGDWDAA